MDVPDLAASDDPIIVLIGVIGAVRNGGRLLLADWSSTAGFDRSMNELIRSPQSRGAVRGPEGDPAEVRGVPRKVPAVP